MKRGGLIFILAVLTGCGEEPGGGKVQKEPVKVFEYTPAPGQFINELPAYDGVTTPEAACEFARKRIDKGAWVSLGGFGGYMVVGLGKVIQNGDGPDFSVTGNQHDKSSEPGVVWVMADDNGNGKPDDTWYELSGSEIGAEGTIQGYEVTYTRPADGKSDVPWTDSEGGSGVISRMDEFNHTQPNYYPAWVAADSYTLRGTRLKPDSVLDGTLWNNRPREWGYADNMGNDRGTGANARKNFFDISNAIDVTGEQVVLAPVDFIKVQSAVNHHVPSLGELSTEVSGFATIPRPE